MKDLTKILVLTLCCGAAVLPSGMKAQARGPEGNGEVTLRGKQLLRDGKPWVPHGFYQVPYEVSPVGFTIPKQKAFWQVAYRNFSPSDYTQMKAQGADSVRMQIAQNGADPLNQQFYDPQWFQQAVGAIKTARVMGLTVIVSLQDEPQTGSGTEAPLPNDATRRVWRELAPIFARDRGVLYELYNEPDDIPKNAPDANHPDNDLPPTAKQWQRWADAMNQTIAVVRESGSVNVIVADGLVHAQQLAGAPELDDPLHKVLYAAHPYVSGTQSVADFNQTSAAWDEKFGHFSATHPVIISEWGINFFCDTNTPAATVAFLQYLHEHQIGLEAGIWDFSGPGFNNLTHGYPGSVEFTTFQHPMGRTCTLNNAPPNYGPGKTVESYYLTGVPPTFPQ